MGVYICVIGSNNSCYELNLFLFQMADNLAHRFGTIGLRITQRIMGLILMVIAVHFVIDGVGSVFKSWFSL